MRVTRVGCSQRGPRLRRVINRVTESDTTAWLRARLPRCLLSSLLSITEAAAFLAIESASRRSSGQVAHCASSPRWAVELEQNFTCRAFCGFIVPFARHNGAPCTDLHWNCEPTKIRISDEAGSNARAQGNSRASCLPLVPVVRSRLPRETLPTVCFENSRHCVWFIFLFFPRSGFWPPELLF